MAIELEMNSEYDITNCNIVAALKLIVSRLGFNPVLVDSANVVIEVFANIGEEVEGVTYSLDEDGQIDVEIWQAPDWELTLAHELVHVAQVICGLPMCEVQAYAWERGVKECLTYQTS